MPEPSNGAETRPQPNRATFEASESGGPASGEPADRLTEVRHLLTEATHRLLGDTIAVNDEDWRAPSRLPGWSRGHVASHIARQADGLGRLVEWARTGERQEMYASDEARDADIEAGSSRSGLELQIDLDTSAERLAEAFETLDASGAWDHAVVLRGGLDAPARMLPLARLGEVVLHHVDLDIGFGVDDIEPEAAAWLLEWAAFRLTKRTEFPSLRLVAPSGQVTGIGPESEHPMTVTGSAPSLLGWLTGRSSPDTVNGTNGLALPPY